MAQSKLLIHPSDGGNGVVHHVTPASAGWRYVGFELRKLRQGERCAVDTGDREVCAILISGKARFTADRFDSGIIGERRNVFEDPMRRWWRPALWLNEVAYHSLWRRPCKT